MFYLNLLPLFGYRYVSGNQLDILARVPLWKYGLDYRHGTGHGVGAFLNVHEGIKSIHIEIYVVVNPSIDFVWNYLGPQGVSYRESAYKQPMEAGMTITDGKYLHYRY